MLPAANRSSLVSSSTALLREQIGSGQWPIGTKIPVEARLAEMLQVSRGTVREAIRSLAVSGMVEVRQGDGTYVRSHTDPVDTLRHLRHANLRDQFEARLGLEVEAVRLGAVRHSPEEIAHLHALLDARGNWKNEQDKPAFVARDFAFHVAIVATAQNTALVELYRFFSSAVTETIAATLGEDIPEPDMPAHRSLIDAIASSDPSRADETLRAFISPVLLTLERLLNQ
jgi:DNA-binding FadR family transcriptional regulator